MDKINNPSSILLIVTIMIFPNTIYTIPDDKDIILTGSEFNDTYKDMIFVKLTNDIEKHNGFQFKDGLNIDTHNFYPHIERIQGGIYFTTMDEVHKWIHYVVTDNYYGCRRMKMKYIRNVIIPDDAKICMRRFLDNSSSYFINDNGVEKCCYYNNEFTLYIKTDKMILESREEISRDIYMRAIDYKTSFFRFVPDHLKDVDMCTKVIKIDGCNLEYVPDDLKDLKICKHAVRNTEYAIRYIPASIRNLKSWPYRKT